MSQSIRSLFPALVARARAFHPLRRYLRARQAIVRAIDRVRLRGCDVYCPCCDSHARRFLPREICAFCGSRPRQRFLWAYLAGVLRIGDCVLHVAPEPCLQARLKALPGVGYVSVDLTSVWADVHVDLQAPEQVEQKLGCGAYSLIVISHVLEHVPDDVGVMRVLCRLLAAGGSILVQVPLEESRPSTYEDWGITTAEGRRKAFGQEDHVRIYGADFTQRLTAAGCQVTAVNPGDVLSADLIARMRLAADTIFVCRVEGDNGRVHRGARGCSARPPGLAVTA